MSTVQISLELSIGLPIRQEMDKIHVFQIGATTSAIIYWVPGTFLSALCVITYLILTTTLWGIPILAMKKLNFQKAK